MSENEANAHQGVDQVVTFSSDFILEDKDCAKECGVPLGILFSPVTELHQSTLLRRAVLGCEKCGSFINLYCQRMLSEGTWNCIFCGYCNKSDELRESEFYPELNYEIVEYADTAQQIINLSTDSNLSPTIAFVIDMNITRNDLESLRKAILDTLEILPKSTRITLISFSNCVVLYELGISTIASGEVFSGISSPSKEDITRITAKLHSFVVPLEQCHENIARILDVMINAAPTITFRDPSVKGMQLRCLGAAVELAVSLFTNEEEDEEKQKEQMVPAFQKKTASSFGRVVAFTNGCPNLGPGGIFEEIHIEEQDYYKEQAIRYYQQLGLTANKHDIGIDLFCGGLKTFNVKILQNLVLANGGLVLLFRDFTTSQLFQNLFLALTRSTGRSGSFDIRLSSGLSITHIIGSATASPVAESGTNYCIMGGVNPKNCYSIFFEHTEDILSKYAYFQFVIKFINSENQRISRIITRRLQTVTAAEKEKFINSVNGGITSILIAKRAVLYARKSDDPSTAIQYLDKTVQNIVAKCGKKQANTSRIQLPPSLVDLPYKLFLVRQGPLLGPILQHGDDIDYVRCLFLNSDKEDSQRIMFPELKSAQFDGFIPLPPEDLALQSNLVLILDHHTDIFIWSGSMTNGSEYDPLRHYCEQLAHQAARRFPQPNEMLLKEGTSAARWIQCRLIPSHKDSPEQQMASFPQLAQLSPEQRQAVVTKFHHTDDWSFEEYCSHLKLFKA